MGDVYIRKAQFTLRFTTQPTTLGILVIEKLNGNEDTKGPNIRPRSNVKRGKVC